MSADLNRDVLVDDEAWRAIARCRTVPQSIFFPGRGEDAAPARAICRACAVQASCREYALSIPDLQGVWAGLSENDRRVINADREQADRDQDRAGPPSVLQEISEHGTAKGTLLRVLEQLRAHPSRWARVARFSSPHSASLVASQLRLGRRPVPPGLWKFATSRNDEGGSDLYARFDGPTPALDLDNNEETNEQP